MKIRDIQSDQRFIFGDIEFTVKEHVKGTRPLADVTICEYRNARLNQTHKTTFCPDIECQPVSAHAENHQHRAIPEIEGVGQLRSDDREGRAGAPAPAGIQTEEQAQQETAGSLPDVGADRAG